MAKKEKHRIPRTKDASKGGKNGKVLPMKNELVLTEVEMLKIKNSNLYIQKLNSDKQALTLQIRETDRAGAIAQENLAKLAKQISTRLGVDLRKFSIEEDGRLLPKKGNRVEAPASASVDEEAPKTGEPT